MLTWGEHSWGFGNAWNHLCVMSQTLPPPFQKWPPEMLAKKIQKNVIYTNTPSKEIPNDLHTLNFVDCCSVNMLRENITCDLK